MHAPGASIIHGVKGKIDGTARCTAAERPRRDLPRSTIDDPKRRARTMAG